VRCIGEREGEVFIRDGVGVWARGACGWSVHGRRARDRVED
jgi:hypothetical protein